MIGRVITTAYRNKPVPRILNLNPGVVIGAPDLRRGIVGIAPGNEPRDNQNADRDQRPGLHELPTEIISTAQAKLLPAYRRLIQIDTQQKQQRSHQENHQENDIAWFDV